MYNDTPIKVMKKRTKIQPLFNKRNVFYLIFLENETLQYSTCALCISIVLQNYTNMYLCISLVFINNNAFTIALHSSVEGICYISFISNTINLYFHICIVYYILWYVLLIL